MFLFFVVFFGGGGVFCFLLLFFVVLVELKIICQEPKRLEYFMGYQILQCAKCYDGTLKFLCLYLSF